MNNTMELHKSMYEQDNLNEEHRNDYLKRLIKTLKIKQIGSGAYANVFQHPTFPDVVVKIFTDSDKGYNKYLKFCLANQNNKHVPKIIDVVHHDSIASELPKHKDSGSPTYGMNTKHGMKYNIVFMEKLKNVTKTVIKNFLKSLPMNELDRYRYTDVEYMGKEIWTKLSKQTENKDVQKIAEFIVSNFSTLDLHDKNIMARGNELVITDPLYSNEGAS